MDAVDHAFQAMPRSGFLLPVWQQHAGLDQPLSIGHGQTNSQPRTVADMLRLLDVSPGARVLDVGSGSGWTTALLAHLTGPGGHVVGVEIVAELVAFGAANLAATNQPHARIEAASPGVLGWPDDAPYDRILVSANATRLPDRLVDQLAEDGLLVIPVAGRMLRVRRAVDGARIERFGWYRFVPLIEPAPRRRGWR